MYDLIILSISCFLQSNTRSGITMVWSLRYNISSFVLTSHPGVPQLLLPYLHPLSRHPRKTPLLPPALAVHRRHRMRQLLRRKHMLPEGRLSRWRNLTHLPNVLLSDRHSHQVRAPKIYYCDFHFLFIYIPINLRVSLAYGLPILSLRCDFDKWSVYRNLVIDASLPS